MAHLITENKCIIFLYITINRRLWILHVDKGICRFFMYDRKQGESCRKNRPGNFWRGSREGMKNLSNFVFLL